MSFTSFRSSHLVETVMEESESVGGRRRGVKEVNVRCVMDVEMEIGVGSRGGIMRYL